MICYKVLHKYKLIDHFETKEIGIYSSMENANSAIEQVKEKNGFVDYQDNFIIKKCFRIIKPKLLNKTFWIDGFDTYTCKK